MKKTAEKLYEMREKRVTDVIELKVPDRIPVTASFAFFPAHYCGLYQRRDVYNPEKPGKCT
jgi:hypothetical protein